jgi:hypothetical protein
MSCFNSNCYLPQPPRAWSRVQNSCSLITDTDNNGLVRDPYTGQLVPAVVLAERIAMLNKGNVLQYKANSSNLTKSQKYSKIAKGQWVNRNTTWATQSTRGYTNPNTTSLKRDGNINVAIDPITGAIIGPTVAPPTCLKPIIQDNEGLPSNGGGGSSIIDPEIPPPVPPTPGSDVFPVIIPDTPPEPIVIQDGGNLICSVQEDICTGETKRSLSQQLCHPTTDSDVPGPIQDLCWNDGNQTWYPRQRYVMTNSANKWPVNAELVSAIINLYPPIINATTESPNQIIISWNEPKDAVNNIIFVIYRSISGGPFSVLNSLPISTFPMSYTDIDVTNNVTYSYYIISKNICAQSEPSNISSATPLNLYETTGTVVISGDYIYFTDSTINGSQTGSIKFNYICDVDFTLVAGGSSAGYWSAGSINGSNAGGGGQILNSSSPFTVQPSTISVSVGSGAPLNSTWPAVGTGQLGYDTQITISSISYSGTIKTSNINYGGGGGSGNINISWDGGGGSGSTGGSTLNVQPSGGGGGGGGALTNVNTLGIVNLVSFGNNGNTVTTIDGGDGGNGKPGIDNVLYGAGGGGGGGCADKNTGLPTGIRGDGGNIGGGFGAAINPYTIPVTTTSATPGSANTGGGGGGGTDDGGSSSNEQNPNIGGSGVAIFKILLHQ